MSEAHRRRVFFRQTSYSTVLIRNPLLMIEVSICIIFPLIGIPVVIPEVAIHVVERSPIMIEIRIPTELVLKGSPLAVTRSPAMKLFELVINVSPAYARVSHLPNFISAPVDKNFHRDTLVEVEVFMCAELERGWRHVARYRFVILSLVYFVILSQVPLVVVVIGGIKSIKQDLEIFMPKKGFRKHSRVPHSLKTFC
jgi:hypothetical protein